MINTKALAIFVLTVIAVAIIFSVYTNPRDNTDFGLAPDIDFPATSEQPAFKLSSMQGHPVIIVFWSADILRCQDQMKQLEILYRKYHRHGLEIIGVSTDDVRSRGYVTSMMHLTGAEFPNVLTADISDVEDKYYFGSVPYLYVIDKAGIIRDRMNGIQTTEKLEPEIKRFLKGH